MLSQTGRKKFNTNKINKKYFSSQPILIKNGVIVNADQKFKANLFIKDGKISKIIKPEDQENSFILPQNIREIDAKNNFVIPGGIDTHTHLQLPFMGTTAVDDFNVGSSAALSGGTTCFLDFVIPDKNESLLKAYDRWRGWADPKVNCDYSLHCAITTWNDEIKNEMAEIVKRGITSFKVFLAYKGALMLNDSEFFKVLERSKELGAICMVHAENGDLLYEAQKKMIELGITGPEAHYLSRPESFEAEATNKAITIAEYTTSPLYIVHVMSKDAAEIVVKSRNKGNVLFGETLAAALGIDGRELWNKDWKIAAGHVMSPPLNPDPTTKTHLMKLLQSNGLQVVGTDNCTFCNSQKAMGKDDFTKIPNGVNGIEDRLSIVWTKGVKEGLLSPSDFVRVTSSTAAQIFNMYPQKGVIQEGADADIVIWNGEKERIISKNDHHQAVDFNVFEGMRVKGESEVTISRGKVVWENGSFTKNLVQGNGKFVERKPFGYAFERIKDLDRARDPRNFKVDRSEKIASVETSEIEKLKEQISNLKDENYKLKKKIESAYSQLSDERFFDERGNIIGIDDSMNEILQNHSVELQKEYKRIVLGDNIDSIEIDNKLLSLSKSNNFEVKAFKIKTIKDEENPPRIVRLGAIQNKIVLPTTDSISKQKQAIMDRVGQLIEAAYHSKVNVIGLQECWTCPFFMCTREKYPWVNFAESALNGSSTQFLRGLAKKYNMVIVSPILERDEISNVFWNTAVIIDNHGDVLGITHKNHIPRVGDFNESTYYMEGMTGNPVYETEFGKIGVNICYGRHHPLHWLGLGLNGAEIVFNPAATVNGLSEKLWFTEGRCAAIANNYFVVSINRVGTETYPNKFTSGDGGYPKNDFGHFYGSSYVTAPDGARTPSLSRVNDGLLITEVDLNMCQFIKDKWGFQMTSRIDMYADLLTKYTQRDYKQQIIRKPKH
jgi:dihydropyrimidinase